MILKRKTASLLLLIWAHFIGAEDFNLFGIPGQGYVVEVNLGHPRQKLNVLLDTGSSSLAVASKARSDISRYFKAKDSNTLYNTGSLVHAKYTEGEWSASLVTDYIQFPSLPLAGEVNSDIALISRAQNFFMNGSGWQGILGLAYPAVSARGPEMAIAQPWLEAVNHELGKTMSFSLKLCGLRSATNATHYGSFVLLDDTKSNQNTNRTYRTPILRERWYEIGILSVRLMSTTSDISEQLVRVNPTDSFDLKNESSIEEVISPRTVGPSQNTCRKLNKAKSILDSGTTNIRLPEGVFRKVVDELRNVARASNILILDEFWYHSEAACWPEPREWDLPWLAIDLLSEDDHQYFTIELPPKSYMRLVSAHSGGGTVSEFCYKLGLEKSTNTVLGVVAFEGLQVTFDKQDGCIGFQTSNCGPDARITGPHNSSVSLRTFCQLASTTQDPAVETIRVAQWIVAVALTVAMTLMVYLLAPCVRAQCLHALSRTHMQVSLSRAALVEEAA